MTAGVTDDRLARQLSLAMGITLDEARTAVLQHEAAHRRQQAIGEALARYNIRNPAKMVSDSDGGTGEDTAEDTGEVKWCQRCDYPLPVSKFSVRKLSPDGLMAWCKSCMRSYHKERKGKPRASRPRLTDEQRAEVLAMLEAGHKYDAITAATGVSGPSISYINRAAGNGPRQRGDAVTDEQRQRTAEMLAAGHSRRDVVAATGLSNSSVDRIRRGRR